MQDFTLKVEKYTSEEQKYTSEVQKYTFEVSKYKKYFPSTKVYLRRTQIYFKKTKVHFWNTKYKVQKPTYHMFFFAFSLDMFSFCTGPQSWRNFPFLSSQPFAWPCGIHIKISKHFAHLCLYKLLTGSITRKFAPAFFPQLSSRSTQLLLVHKCFATPVGTSNFTFFTNEPRLCFAIAILLAFLKVCNGWL